MAILMERLVDESAPYSHKHQLEQHKWSNIFYGKFLPTQNLPFNQQHS